MNAVSANAPVWVIDGAPEYHLERCGRLGALPSEPVTYDQAIDDGFEPCNDCAPDVAMGRDIATQLLSLEVTMVAMGHAIVRMQRQPRPPTAEIERRQQGLEALRKEHDQLRGLAP